MRRWMLAAVLSVIGLAGVVRCPIENSPAAFTGRSEVRSGRLLHEYECAVGDRFWVIAR